MNCCATDLAPAAALFRSLADPARLAIVSRLAEGEARVVDLTRILGLAQSTVSKHLACLRDCQLVEFRAEGRQSYYSLARPELIDLRAAPSCYWPALATRSHSARFTGILLRRRPPRWRWRAPDRASAG